MLNNFSPIRLFAALQTVACQAPLSMRFPRQEHWSGLPCCPPADIIPRKGLNLHLLCFLHWRVGSLPLRDQNLNYANQSINLPVNKYQL